MVKQLAEQHNLPLKTGYNTIRGFHVQLYIGPGAGDVAQGLTLESMPKEFMKPSKNRNTISFTTTDMVTSEYIVVVCLFFYTDQTQWCVKVNMYAITSSYMCVCV